MDLPQIEAARQALQVSQYELCQRADIHPTTYTKLLSRQGGTSRTLRKLSRAIEDLQSGRVSRPATVEDVRNELQKLIRGDAA